MTKTKATPSQLWLERIYDSDLSSSQKAVAAFLASRMYGHKKSCFPSATTIAEKTGFSTRRTRDHLNALIAQKWIESNSTNRAGSRILTIRTPDTVSPPDTMSPDTMSPLTPCHPPPDTVSPESVTESVIKHISIRGWDEWVSYRKEIKKKMTPATVKRQVKQLEDLTPEQQLATIEQSITNGWTGLFPDKVINNGTSRRTQTGVQQSGKTTVADRLRADIAAIEGRSRA